MFNTTPQYNAIIKELSIINALDKIATFQCFDESIFTYGYRENNAYHEFSFMCEDTLLCEMPIYDLLELKKIKFFSHDIYLEDTNSNSERIAGVHWSMHEYSGLN